MAFALLLFAVLLVVGRSELGIKGIAICIASLLGLIIVVAASGSPAVLVASGAALLDIGMIIFIFGTGIPLRPKR
jgi:hypothetical protein